MPTATYDLIASNVLTSSASSVTFSSIPATYRDLVLVMNGNVTSTTDVWLKFNSSSTGYSRVQMLSGPNSASYTDDRLYLQQTTSDSTLRLLNIVQIMDYSTTDKHKTALNRVIRGTTTDSGAVAHRWANTAAISSIVVEVSSNFASGYSFYLYGIAS